MFGWIKKKILDASTDSIRNDILRFIESLKGADPDEITTMLVFATVLRLHLTEAGRIPPAALDLSIFRDQNIALECDMCPLTLGNFIKEFQRMNQPSDALGVMIWLHSVRALKERLINAFGCAEMAVRLRRGARNRLLAADPSG